MATDRHLLIIDQGGHSSRALIFNSRAELVANAATELTTAVHDNGHIEQNPAEVLQTIHQSLQQLPHEQLQKVDAAGLIVQRSSLLACRKGGEPLTAVLSWQDTRNRDWLEQQQLDLEAIHKSTGLRANAHYGASKMRWLLDNDQAVQDAAAQDDLLFVPLAAWLAQQLTGSAEITVDPVIAQRTLLTNRQHHWDDDLLSLFGIQRNQLPRIVNTDHHFGCLRESECEIPLQLVGGDQSFLPLAFGRSALQHSAFINIGTGAFVQAVMPMEQVPSALLASPVAVTADDQLTIAEGTVNAAASALDWYWQQHKGTADFEQLERVLNDAGLNQSSELVFLNTMAGTGSPYWLPQQVPEFVGEDDTQSEQLLAVAESIVFALQDNLQLMREVSSDIQQIIVSGGLSRSNGLCQRLADLTGLKVMRPDDHEASARGAAVFMLGSEMSHLLSGAEAFMPQQNRMLLRRYQLYSRLISQRS